MKMLANVASNSLERIGESVSCQGNQARRWRQACRAGLLAGGCFSLFSVSPARAQDAGSEARQGMGEIIVTAQRREQSIQRVGIAITALSGEELAKTGVTSAQDIARQVPALEFDSGSGGGVNAFVTIRGVSQVDYSEHQEAPNAVYLDDVYVPTPSMVAFPVYDMARAEALRGPQGTLFGRNSTGGLLHFVTKDPTREWDGYFNTEYGSFETGRMEGAVGGPLADGVAFRLAGFGQIGNGWFKNDNPGSKDSFESYSFGVRGKLAVDLGPDWKATLAASINKSPRHREGTYKAYPAYVDANGVTQFVPANVDIYGTGAGNDPYGYRDPNPDGNEGSFNDGGFLKKQTYYGTLKIEGSIGDATLTSITNYTNAKLDYLEDSDGTPNNVFLFLSGGYTRQISQELRLSGDTGSLNWTAGAYFLDIKGSYYTDFYLVGLFDAINRYKQKTRSWAVFGQVEYEFLPAVKLTVGGRYTHDRKIFDSRVYIGPGDPTFDPTVTAPYWEFNEATFGDAARQSRGDWAGKAQLSYEPSNNILLYAGVSRGIRGGGFNATADGSLDYNDVQFGPETVVAYEAGTKLRLFDGKANVRASAFYYDYSDYQAFNYNGLISTVSNSDAYYTGGEIEIFANPMQGLNISFGVSYLDAKVKDLVTPQGIADVRPVKAPEWSLNGLVTKSFDIGVYQLGLQYDFDYQSESRANLVQSPVTRLPASWMHNARISFGREEQGWELYGFVRNFTDVDRRTFAYDNSWAGLAIASYAPPRTYGVGFRKDF